MWRHDRKVTDMDESSYDELLDLIDELRCDAYVAGTRQHGLDMIDRDTRRKLGEICGMSDD